MKKDVIKPSPAIALKADLTLIERQLWNILFAKAYDTLKTQDTFTISEQDILAYFPYETRNTAHVKECLKRLVGTVVEYNYLDKDKSKVWGCFGLLSYSEMKKGVCTYSYAPKLREMLDDQLMYAKISLLISMRFSSKYALILYEIACDYRGLGKIPWMDLEHFRGLMGIEEGEYKRFNNLKSRVINPALKEINTKSDLLLKLEVKKEGKSISKIQFWIAQSKNIQPEFPLFEPTKEHKISKIKNMLQGR